MIRAVLTFALFLPTPFLAQTSFAVAAIKPNNSGAKASSWNVSPGGLTVENMSLRRIIQAAYSLQDYQYSGPSWLDNENYNINAKPETRATDGKQVQLMMQNLLAERCKLVVHRETREVAGFALVIAKGGLKIHPSEGEGWNMRSANHDTKITATHAGMPQLAIYLAKVLGQPVADETEIKDHFDFTIEYADPRPGAADNADGSASLPSIFTALSEQLGLKLAGRKVPVEILVVDSAERCSEN